MSEAVFGRNSGRCNSSITEDARLGKGGIKQVVSPKITHCVKRQLIIFAQIKGGCFFLINTWDKTQKGKENQSNSEEEL